MGHSGYITGVLEPCLGLMRLDHVLVGIRPEFLNLGF